MCGHPGITRSAHRGASLGAEYRLAGAGGRLAWLLVLALIAIVPAAGSAQEPPGAGEPYPLAAPAQAPTGRFGDPGNRFSSYKLSYVQGDRAAALLKVLGYSVIEFQPAGSQPLVYDKVFDALPRQDELRLPVVIRLIDSEKTSLLEPIPVAPGGAPPGYGGGGGNAGGAGAPLSLGGLFLDRVTDGVPQQRLLIVYDGADPVPMQVLLNLLHDHIDVPAQQLLIEALVVELDEDRLSDVGIEFEGSKDGSSFSFGGEAGGLTLPFTYLFQRPSPKTLFEFSLKLKALVTRGHAQVLSRPSVLVLDGRQARIQVGEKIPFTSSISATNTGTLSSTDYLTTGIVLNLRPRISGDGSAITMQVETIISSAGPSAFIAATGVLVAPPIQSREVQTLVRVANDTPFIIGGLIATQEQNNESGVPGLSRIPLLGRLFRKETRNRNKKEVIVVITPHVVPLEDRSFSYVIPKDSAIFDSFDREVFRNVYRLEPSDLFDLSFIAESQVLRDLRVRLRSRCEAEPGLGEREPFKSLLAGRVPGEEILVRRMLWELVREKSFGRHVDPERIAFFADTGDEQGLHFTPLALLLAARKKTRDNTLVLTFEGMRATTVEHPFDPPRGAVSYEQLRPEEYLARLRQGNRRREDGSWELNTVPLTEAYADTTPPLERLQAALVLKRLLELNGDLTLDLAHFHVGREIVFPSVGDLRNRMHLVDREAARLFYESEDYYLAFEQEFTRETRRILAWLDGHGSL